MIEHDRIAFLEHRVAEQAKDIAELKSSHAVSRNDREHMDRRFMDLDRKVEKIDGSIAKVVWLLISAIILAFANFMVAGGLSIGGA